MFFIVNIRVLMKNAYDDFWIFDSHYLLGLRFYPKVNPSINNENYEDK